MLAGYQHYPEKSQATVALLLGILGLMLVGILAPLALVIANKELAAIDAGRRSPNNRATAKTGRFLGIVGTLLVLGVVLLFVLALVGVTQAS